MGSRQTRRVRLAARVAAQWPAWGPAAVEAAIQAGEVLVGGRVVTNPEALVGPAEALRHAPARELAGRRKLGWAIERFGVTAAGLVALDVGACTGGFTLAWLDAGARRVYAVDAGHGQLLGSLRQDPRVVDLERTNVAALSAALIPEPVDVVSVDVSYLSLSAAVTQLGGFGNVLLGLVKPMFELRLATIPSDPAVRAAAVQAAVAGVSAAGWTVVETDECPVRGAGGAVEFFLHAVRA